MACFNCGRSSGRHMRLCMDCSVKAETYDWMERTLGECETLEDVKDWLGYLLQEVLDGEDLQDYLRKDQKGERID